MEAHEAAVLIEPAVPSEGGIWADIGAGTGTFTRALIERIGAGGRVYAVDRDRRALASLDEWAAATGADVITVLADFTADLELPGLQHDRGLDGMMLANALHFVADPERVLARLVRRVRPGGRIVFVEYDGRGSNPWVPYPISRQRLPDVAAAAGLAAPTFVAARPSAYGGTLYVAVAMRPVESAPERLA